MVDNFGQFLKHERELRGVPLEEIAGATKIHIRFLQALEDNQFDALPGEVFVKGYLRSYAKAIGYDAQDLLRAYDNFLGKSQTGAQAEASPSRRKKAAPKPWMIGGALAAGVALAFMMFARTGEDDKQEAADSSPAVMAENTANDAVESPPVLTLKEKILETVDEKPDASPKKSQPKQAEKKKAEKAVKKNAAPEVKEPKPKEATAQKPDSGKTLVKKKAEVAAAPQPKTKPEKKQDLKAQEKKDPEPKKQPVEKKAEPQKKAEPKPAELNTAALKPPQELQVIRQAEEKVTAPIKNPASSPVAGQDETESSVKAPVSDPEPENTPPETPIESQVTEKNSDSDEKEVIIQSVADNFAVVGSVAEAPEIEEKSLHLIIQVQGNSWFNLAVDGKPEEDFILPGGTSKSFYGNDKFRVTIGNRRGTQLFLNGQALDIPSSSGDVVRDFEITSQFLE